MTLIFDVGYCIKKAVAQPKKKNGGGWLAAVLTDVHM